MNKYALFKYTNSNNIGDEIQSIAARRFMPKVDYYIDRDNVGDWKNSNAEENVKLIANGWYMHEPHAWPITDKTISPLLISMHVNESDAGVAAYFSSEKSRGYMNAHGPVGARDFSTNKFFSKVGVESYFSACLTTTLQRDERIRKQDFILAVSVSDETYNFIKSATTKRVIRFNPYVNRGIDNIEKTKIAEHTLLLYQSAICVVTTKVHAMLPSLAFDTPVLFVDENEEYDPSRFDGLVELVNSTSKNDLLLKKYKYDFENPPRNPQKHALYRDDLIKRCEDFTGYRGNKSFIRTIDVTAINQESLTSRLPVTDEELSASELIGHIKQPTFSIIMPAYNIEAYITRAVSSIKDQSFTDFECIVVDDGSTDKSIAVISDMIKNDGRFKVLSQKNGGLSNARNNGYELARGEYVLFLDGDDQFSDTLLESIHENIFDTKADIVVFNHSILDNTTGRISKGVHLLSELSGRKSVTPQQISKNIFNIFGNQVWTKAFKRELIVRHRLRFNEHLKRAEDIPFTYPALLSASKISVIDKPLVAYRVNRGDSNSDSLAAHYKDIFTALNDLYSFIKKRPESERYMSSFDVLFLENIGYNLRSLVGTDRFLEEFELSKKYIKKFKINSRKDAQVSGDLADLCSILLEENYDDLLIYFLNKEKKYITDNQTTLYYLEDHVTQLEKSLTAAENKNIALEESYLDLEKKYNELLRIPRKVKRGMRKIKRMAQGGK